MSGNNKIVWDQPHETTEEGEREARGGWGKAGVSDSSLCARLPHTPPPSKIFFSELSQSEDAWLHTEEMSAKAKERGKLQMTATLMRSLWLHIAEIVSGSTWLPITVNRCVRGSEKFSLWESTVLKATRVKGLCITSLLLMTRGPEPQRCWHTVQATVSRNSEETLLYCSPARLYCMYYTVSHVSCTAAGKTVCILDSLCQGASHLLMFIINELRSSDNIIGCF